MNLLAFARSSRVPSPARRLARKSEVQDSLDVSTLILRSWRVELRRISRAVILLVTSEEGAAFPDAAFLPG